LLYESEWGKGNPAAVKGALDSAAEAGRKLEVAPDGRLLRCSDADDILGLLVLIDRFASRVLPRER